jgi:hypothetical protein
VTWRDQALCVEYPDLTWVMTHTFGEERANQVVATMEVCASCPVRVECLTDTIIETRYTVDGMFGGTTMTERSRAVNDRRRHARAVIDDERTEWVPSAHLDAKDDRRIRLEAADDLESTFTPRLRDWKWRSSGGWWCPDCGQSYLWPKAEPICTRSCIGETEWRNARRRYRRKQRHDLDQGVKVAA